MSEERKEEEQPTGAETLYELAKKDIPGTFVSPGKTRKRQYISFKAGKQKFEELKKMGPSGERRYKQDVCKKSKKLLKKPTVSWAKNPGIADVPGIDAPRTGKDFPKVCGPKKKSRKRGK